MKSALKVTGLLFLTIFFVCVGGVVIYFSIDRIVSAQICRFNEQKYSKGEEIPGYREGYVCSCDGGEVFCTKAEKKLEKLPIDSFGTKNLTSSVKFASFGEVNGLTEENLYTRFLNVSIKGDTIEIALEQIQSCSKDQRAPVQLAMYNFENDNLLVTNVINKSPSLYVSPCLVSMSYKISKISVTDMNDLKIGYMNDKGEILEAVLCHYNLKVFGQGDIYSAIDNCNICKCENGISRCGNDRVCDE